MNKRICVALLTIGMMGTATFAAAENASAPALPIPSAGMSRWVINVPKRASESLLGIEVIPGKLAEIDCNQHFLIGQMQPMEQPGLGYTYYQLRTDGVMGGTKMACPDASKHKAFVPAPSGFVAYNSKLPLVVLTPQGYSVQYRVWQGALQTQAAESK